MEFTDMTFWFAAEIGVMGLVAVMTGLRGE